jgi:Putative heavy-metal-binding
MSLPCHPILYRMRLDHPDDHPDDPSGPVWTDGASNVSRLDPSGAVQVDAEHLARNRKVVGSNPTFVLDETLFRCSLMLITTIPGIEGRTVTEYLGVVTAQGVLEVNVFKDVGAGMRNIFELASGVSDALAETEKQAASGTAVKLG